MARHDETFQHHPVVVDAEVYAPGAGFADHLAGFYPKGFPAVLRGRPVGPAGDVSGDLQDLKRAAVVGGTSDGKGSVQDIIPQAGGTALRLTIATYHTPSGRTPHEVGITPDVAVEIKREDRDNLNLFRRRESLTPAERKTLKAWKDPVVDAAIKALST